MVTTAPSLFSDQADTGCPACEAIALRVLEAGILRVYTVPGDLTYGLLRAFDLAGLSIYACRSQAAAVFASAADSFAQGDLVSVVLVSRGPASHNAMAAVASVLAQGTPILVLSPVENQRDTERGAFQGGGVSGIAEAGRCPVLRLTDLAQVETLLPEVLRAGRGPNRTSAVIEIERPVLGGVSEAVPAPRSPVSAPAAQATEIWLDAAMDVLNRARRVVLVVGHMARWSVSCAALVEVASLLKAPICPTGLSLGFAGAELETVPQAHVHKTLAAADAVLLLGASLDWSLRFGAAIEAAAGIVQMIPDERAAVGRPADILVLGDIGANLSALSSQLRRQGGRALAIGEDLTAGSLPRCQGEYCGQLPLMDHVMQLVGAQFPVRAALVVDGSSPLVAGAQSILPKLTWARMTPGVAGHLGAGIGHALGAMATGRFDQVIVVAGDFSLGLAMGDLETLLRYDLAVKILVSNNRGIKTGAPLVAGADPRMTQYAQTVDHAAIMRGFGGAGYRVCSPQDWNRIAASVFSSTGPCLVDILG
ncbi:thiamine pyrophosphate-dependent enzyme [Parasedimentitalea huanghaiensis]|uniref:Acetolactate synthase-1/2/3 large subunit n=1 Tax=Parasedimentitalea huanghaiensis TaxID=2682100 RepID=A0A6L6WPD2_9RHOB|nr:thiamine pyrophosphate-dependent enzyme [Zongyanglinia huanghaiensis]MVO18535.1 hypothetical protein [Zongyanglinia huanghaiensis]